MRGPALLLIPSFTELEWGIKPQLEEWADVATFDPPGVGEEPLPDDLTFFRSGLSESEQRSALWKWRDATADRGLAELDRLGWNRFVVVMDSYGTPAGVRITEKRPESVGAVAIGHAALSHATDGDRAPIRGELREALRQLLRQDRESFVRHGVAQMTRGGVDEATVDRMLERLPELDALAGFWEAIGRDPESIREPLARLIVPLLLAKHEGCLVHTDEGYEDIVAAFPNANTVRCPEACISSPTFAAAIRNLCAEIGAFSESSTPRP